jgi:hypothetical protein
MDGTLSAEEQEKLWQAATGEEKQRFEEEEKLWLAATEEEKQRFQQRFKESQYRGEGDTKKPGDAPPEPVSAKELFLVEKFLVRSNDSKRCVYAHFRKFGNHSKKVFVEKRHPRTGKALKKDTKGVVLPGQLPPGVTMWRTEYVQPLTQTTAGNRKLKESFTINDDNQQQPSGRLTWIDDDENVGNVTEVGLSIAHTCFTAMHSQPRSHLQVRKSGPMWKQFMFTKRRFAMERASEIVRAEQYIPVVVARESHLPFQVMTTGWCQFTSAIKRNAFLIGGDHGLKLSFAAQLRVGTQVVFEGRGKENGSSEGAGTLRKFGNTFFVRAIRLHGSRTDGRDGKQQPPLCIGHGEHCVLKPVHGYNQWVCSMPEGQQCSFFQRAEDSTWDSAADGNVMSTVVSNEGHLTLDRHNGNGELVPVELDSASFSADERYRLRIDPFVSANGERLHTSDHRLCTAYETTKKDAETGEVTVQKNHYFTKETVGKKKYIVNARDELRAKFDVCHNEYADYNEYFSEVMTADTPRHLFFELEWDPQRMATWTTTTASGAGGAAAAPGGGGAVASAFPPVTKWEVIRVLSERVEELIQILKTENLPTTLDGEPFVIKSENVPDDLSVTRVLACGTTPRAPSSALGQGGPTLHMLHVKYELSHPLQTPSDTRAFNQLMLSDDVYGRRVQSSNGDGAARQGGSRRYERRKGGTGDWEHDPSPLYYDRILHSSGDGETETTAAAKIMRGRLGLLCGYRMCGQASRLDGTVLEPLLLPEGATPPHPKWEMSKSKASHPIEHLVGCYDHALVSGVTTQPKILEIRHYDPLDTALSLCGPGLAILVFKARQKLLDSLRGRKKGSRVSEAVREKFAEFSISRVATAPDRPSHFVWRGAEPSAEPSSEPSAGEADTFVTADDELEDATAAAAAAAAAAAPPPPAPPRQSFRHSAHQQAPQPNQQLAWAERQLDRPSTETANLLRGGELSTLDWLVFMDEGERQRIERGFVPAADSTTNTAEIRHRMVAALCEAAGQAVRR